MPQHDEYEYDEDSDELDIHPTGGGMFGGSGVYRSDREVFGGAAPPIVSDTPRGATQWLVKVDKNGRPQEVGSIAIRASVDDLIETFHASIPEGGTVYLFPIDMAGQLLKDEPVVKDISPGHQAYARIAKKKALAASVGGSNGGLSGLGGLNSMQDIQALLHQMQERDRLAEERIRERERQLAEEYRRKDEEFKALLASLQDKEDRVARERLALQAEQQEKFHEVTLRMVEADQSRAESQMTQMQQMFHSMEQRNQANFQQTLQLITASADQDRRRDKERLEEERRRAEERERERDKEHQRYLERMREEARQRREEDQKYHERQMELIRKQSESNDLTKQITKALAIGSKWGIIPEGGLGALIGMGGKSSMAETIAGVLGKGIDAALEAQKTQIEAVKEGGGGMLAPDDDPLVQVQMPTGQILVIRQSEYMEMQAQMQQQAQIPQQALVGQAPAPLGPQPGMQQQVAPQPGMQQPIPPAPAAPQAPSAPPEKDDFLLRPTAAQPAAPPAKNPAKGLPAKVQKQGRAAVQRVAETIRQNANEDDDTAEIEVSAVILHELLNCEPFGDYLAAVSVEGALEEAGIEPPLIERTIRLALNNDQVAANQKTDDAIPMRKGDL